jgi:NTP pyrophosphatase (non-canonical NTP hydrolase)
MMIEYTPGDFCREIDCEWEVLRDSGVQDHCENCIAYMFHDYLKRRGFHISKDILEFRPFIRWSAGLMEMDLIKNETGETEKRQKPPWETKEPPEVWEKVAEEVGELRDAYADLLVEENRTDEKIQRLKEEAVDVAVTAMMLASLFDPEMKDLRRGR